METIFTTFAIVFLVFTLGFTVVEYIISMAVRKEIGYNNVIKKKAVAYFYIFLLSWIYVVLIRYKTNINDLVVDLNAYLKVAVFFLLWVSGGLLYSIIRYITYKIAIRNKADQGKDSGNASY